jgi:hypothetical protein
MKCWRRCPSPSCSRRSILVKLRALHRQLRASVVMREQAGVTGAGRKAVVEALPEAVEACAEVGDERVGQAPTDGTVEVLLKREGLHDPG